MLCRGTGCCFLSFGSASARPTRGRFDSLTRGPANGRNRRVAPVGARSGEGPLSERTSGHSDLVVRAALDAKTRSLVPLPAFSSSLSYYDGCVALAARPICCRAYATISVPTLIVASTRRARSTRAGARTARKSRSASPLRQVIPPPWSCPRLLTRWLAGCAVARLVFPVLCRDTGTEAGALHQRPAVRGQLISEDDARCSFNRAPRWVLVRCSLSLSPCPTVLLLRRRRPALPSLNRRRSSEPDIPW
jgi:hypothetical protein